MAKVFPQITVKVSASRMDLITTCVFRTLSGKLITGSMTATVSVACIFLEIIEAPSRLPRAAVFLAIPDSYACAGSRRQLGLGPERSLGKRSAIWLQPALSTDAAGRSQYTCFSLRSGHRREWSVYGRTAADWLRRLLLPGPRRFQVAEIPGTRYDHAVPGPHLLHCGQARPEVRWGDPPRRRQECCLREFEGQHYVSWRYLESRFNPVGGFFCRFPV